MIDPMVLMTPARMRQYRKRLGLRQSDLAELAGSDRGFVRNLELGRLAMSPRSEALMLLTMVRFERRAVEAERDSKKALDGETS